MIERLFERRLLVCVGPGGVGKTTLAAALALGAARTGRRVAVITIDPAKRLADALGLDGLDDALRPVAGVEPGTLEAAMLDTKTSYDALIARVAPDAAALERIVSNRVYKSFSRSLARSHAYIAMERLYDVLQTGGHDLVVLDTPPTRSALDILDAPGRLARFLDERVLDAFVGEGQGASAWLRRRGTEVALRLFGAMVGEGLMGELASFFEVFFHLRHGFAARAEAVQAALTGPTTGFVLVTAPQLTHLSDASYLHDGLVERGVRFDAMLFNRAFHRGRDGEPVCEAPPYDLGPEHRAIEEAARAATGALARENRDFRSAMDTFSRRPDVPIRHAFPILVDEPASLPALLELLGSGQA